MKTLFTLLFISAQLFAFGQNDSASTQFVHFAVIDTPPLMEGCEGTGSDMKTCFLEEVSKYLKANLHYPEKAKKENISAKIYVSFMVEVDGTINEVKIQHSAQLHAEQDDEAQIAAANLLDAEAIRVIKSLSFRQPALHQNIPMRMLCTVPVYAIPE